MLQLRWVTRSVQIGMRYAKKTSLLGRGHQRPIILSGNSGQSMRCAGHWPRFKDVVIRGPDSRSAEWFVYAGALLGSMTLVHGFVSHQVANLDEGNKRNATLEDIKDTNVSEQDKTKENGMYFLCNLFP